MAGSMTIVLVGTPVADPELRFLDDGTAVGTVRIAVNEPTSRAKKKVTFFRVTFWRDQATRLNDMVKKGTPIAVVGNFIESRQWTNAAGEAQVTTEVSGQSWNFAGNRDSNPAAEDVPAGGEAPTSSNVDDIPF